MNQPVSNTKTALITGASSGIGWELARLFAEDGYSLVLIARDEGKLLELTHQLKDDFSTESTVIAADLSDPEVPESIYEIVSGEEIIVDVLVNNAGFGVFGPFVRNELKAYMDLMQVNMTSLVQLTHLFLPDMIERGRGRIMNVASTAAFQPGPYMSIYYASKAFVLSFSEAIAEEVEDSGITVTAFCPGMTRTDFHRRAGLKGTGLMRHLFADADVVSRIGYDGTMAGKRIVIPGLMNRLIAFGVQLAPRKLVTGIVGKLQKQRD